MEVRFRLPDGKRSDPVKVLPTYTLDRLFVIAAGLVSAQATGDNNNPVLPEGLDLTTPYPVKNLKTHADLGLDKTVAEAALAGGMITVRLAK